MPNKARSSKFLVGHTKSILGFYEPVVFDSRGGFFQNFLDDGSVFDPVSRHLVSSTRFVFNYSRHIGVATVSTTETGLFMA